MPFDKLYVKITCIVCKGTRLFEHSGHHDPTDPYKWKSCLYCDYEGLQLIEASDSTIVRYFEEMKESKRAPLLLMLHEFEE